MNYVIIQDIDLFSAQWENGLKFTKEKDPSDIHYFQSKEREENKEYFVKRNLSYAEVIKFGLDKE